MSTENDDIERQRPATETFPLPPVSAYGRHVADRGTKRTFDELAASSTESYHLAVQEVIDQLLELPRDDWPIIYDELTFVVRIGERAVNYDSGFAIDPHSLAALGQMGFCLDLGLNPEQP